MSGTIIVGIILSITFLVSFSEWFYHLVVGVNELIPYGYGFYFNIFKFSAGGLSFMALVFWTLSMVYECPKPNREGIFEYMDCRVYYQAKARSQGLTQPFLDGTNEIDQESANES